MSTNYNNKLSALSILLLIRRVQQKNRFVTLDLDFPLSIIQSFILLEVASGRNSAKSFAELFKVDQSTMSRHLTNLCRLGYLNMKQLKTDSRKRLIQLSVKGKSFIARYDKASNQVIANYSKLLSDQQREEFAKYFRMLNDQLGSPKLDTHKGDKPWRLEMRRIIFGLDAFNESFMNSRLSIAEWQVLSELKIRNKSLNQAEIANITGIAQTSLPALVARLIKRRLIKASARKEDGRSRDLTLLADGYEAVKNLETEFINTLEKALNCFDKNDILNFISIFEKFIGETTTGDILISDDSIIKKIDNLDERNILRTEFLQQLAAKNKLNQVPGRVFDEESQVWKICDRSNNLLGGIELIKAKDQLYINNFFALNDNSEQRLLKNCIDAINIDCRMK